MDPEVESHKSECLPSWAQTYKPDGELEPYRQLCTRDGRIVGNAFIVKEVPCLLGRTFKVITDVGNVMIVLPAEIHGYWYIGEYISRPESIPGMRFIKDEK